MSTETPIRIGFAGVGNMGQNAHLRHYATLPQCKVVALAEFRPELAKRVAAKYEIPGVYTDIKDMLAKEQLDAIVASQGFSRHGAILPELFAANRPILTEKPLAGSVQVGEKLLQQSQAANCTHVVAYHKRSDPATMWAKAEVDRIKQSGELGAMTYIRIIMPAGDWIANGFWDLLTSKETWPAKPFDPAPDDMDKATYDKYIWFVNYYIHQVNLMRHFLGENYQVDYADPKERLFVGHSVSGVSCTLELSPYETGVAWQEEVLVCFKKGWVKLQLPAPLTMNRAGRVTVYKDPGNGATPMQVQPTLPWVGAMRQQAINFIEFVQGKRPPMCDAVEALEDLRVSRQYLKLLTGK